MGRTKKKRALARECDSASPETFEPVKKRKRIHLVLVFLIEILYEKTKSIW